MILKSARYPRVLWNEYQECAEDDPADALTTSFRSDGSRRSSEA